MKLYKVLGENGGCYNGGTGQWHLPKRGPGEWMPKIEGNLRPCENGYHLCRRDDLIHWLGPAIYEAEYRGEVVKDNEKVVVREARLTRRIETWNERTARLFAADCAEHVLPLFLKSYPNDDRPAKAIQAARDFADGKIKAAARADARAAAWADVGAAAWADARAVERKWQTKRLFEYLGWPTEAIDTITIDMKEE